MTKKIGNSLLIKRLINRYQLTELEPQILSLSEQVSPICDADAALRKLKTNVSAASVTATGDKEVLYVPKGKRWWLIGVSSTIDSGTFTMSQLRCKSNTGNYTILVNQTGGTILYWQPTIPMYIDYAWTLNVTVDAYTGAGSITTVAMILETDGDNE